MALRNDLFGGRPAPAQGRLQIRDAPSISGRFRGVIGVYEIKELV